MKEKKEKQMYWFVEPIGGHTNEVIAKRLAELGEIADATNQELKDNDGKPHSVFSVVSHQRVLELYKSQDQFRLTFNVYAREKNSGPIRLSLIDTKEFKISQNLKKIQKKITKANKSK